METRAAGQIAVAARGLVKEYGHRTVLRQIDLDLACGRAIGLMGTNGAGKTTLLSCLAATIRPTEGVVYWFGSPATVAVDQRKWMGVVSHESRLYPQLTLLENLVFSGRMYGARQPRQRAIRLLAEVGLAAYGERLPTEVSRGMRQRAAVVRALLHEPRILLLDEPFSGLDVEGVQWLMETLQRERDAGRAICFATHDASKATELADEIWQLGGGRVTRFAAVESTVTNETWRAARAA
jgi:ABC-type multidrug transport system ATPase subunit